MPTASRSCPLDFSNPLTDLQFFPSRTLIRASRHEELFTIATNEGPTSLILRLGDESVSYRELAQPFPEYLAPGPDAATLFTGSHGLANADGEGLGAAPPFLPGTKRSVGNCIPGSVPGLFLNLRFSQAYPSPPGTQGQELYLCVQGEHRVGLQLPKLGEFPINPPPQFGDDAMALDKRVLFRPDLKQLITLPGVRNAIVVHELDVFERLKHSADDRYLLVSSIPPASARAGQTYRYPIQVQSAVGDVGFDWVSGPAGWSVSKAGVVSGRVPGGEKTPLRVEIRIKDKESNDFPYGFSVLTRP